MCGGHFPYFMSSLEALTSNLFYTCGMSWDAERNLTNVWSRVPTSRLFGDPETRRVEAINRLIICLAITLQSAKICFFPSQFYYVTLYNKNRTWQKKSSVKRNVKKADCQIQLSHAPTSNMGISAKHRPIQEHSAGKLFFFVQILQNSCSSYCLLLHSA